MKKEIKQVLAWGIIKKGKLIKEAFPSKEVAEDANTIYSIEDDFIVDRKVGKLGKIVRVKISLI
jgi:hypothetical protein